ncbi:IS66 family transposase [Escherichia coli]|uniref:IS66 family transposase n=1 Tax=Escherichia coli TaxID=562 RepID=UPI003CCA4561
MAVLFAYSPTEKASIRRPICGVHTGVLQADAYAGFNELYRDGRITEAAFQIPP